jgi:DNA-binding response OmpR family regulator
MEKEINPAGNKAMPKVMVIEDDTNMFSLLQMLLEFEGFEVVLWEGGEEVQQIVSEICLEKPDLILLDVHLRHMNGFEVLQKIKSDAELGQVKVLIASGVDMTKRSKQEGADGFILKPFMPDELIGEIQKTLD